MKTETIFSGVPITLEEILDARTLRAERQKELLSLGGTCLISFSLNIPGAVKQFPLARAAFETGLSEIEDRIPSGCLLKEESACKKTGSEVFLLLSSAPRDIKSSMAALEENHPLGRLFDIDVLDKNGRSLSRTELGLPPRACLVCGENAKACARSQAHSPELVLWRTAQILNDYFRGRAADKAASCGVRALLYEVSATPKPGLVDRDNSGSHKDMDFFTFLDSSAALIPWFRDFFCLGWDHAGEPDELLFSRLRFSGKEAEKHMLAATGGVNTHKGLIFSFAILCAALGRVHASSPAPLDRDQVLSVCRRLGACSLKDFEKEPCSAATAGERFHFEYGIPGARGEAAAGFPSAVGLGLPALENWLSCGLSLNDAAALCLLTLLSQVDDTNMLHRGGLSLALECKKEAGRLLSSLKQETLQAALKDLDASYTKKNLSPGGCADLLAVSLMFHFLGESGLLSVSPRTDS